MSTRRILFVDDEERVLSGIRRMLFDKEDEWTTYFANGGAEALEIIGRDDIDVVVSDMRMPQMDGATLLVEVKQRFPRVVRIILSGHTELEAAIKSVPVAHQFLSKPCDPDLLHATVERACRTQDELTSIDMREAFGSVDVLPSPPARILELNNLLMQPEVELSAVGRLVATDPAMSAKVLQLVNSAFFGLAKEVSEITQAVSFIGLSMIRDLCASVELSRALAPKHQSLQPQVDALHIHARQIAHLAGLLVDDKSDAQNAFAAGLLHETGLLALASVRPNDFVELMAMENLRHCGTSGDTIVEKERGRIGTDHARLGGYLLDLWGLPHRVVEAVACHHSPELTTNGKIDIPAAVHLADALILQRGGAGHCGDHCGLLEEDSLEHSASRQKIEGWIELSNLGTTDSAA